MRMNLKPTFRYQFINCMKAAAIVYPILIIIVAAFLISALTISADSSSYYSFTGYCFTTTIFMFVIGVTFIRSDLRLCLQFGVSRRTTFVSELLAVLTASLVLAVAGEILIGTAQAFSAANKNFFFADIYQLFYLEGESKLTFIQHIISALFSTSLMFASCLLGMFFSLMFWRLNKFWTVVAAISIPLLINGIPALLYKAGVDFTPFINWLSYSPFNFMLFFILIAALIGIINWLILRNANIKAAKI